MIYSWWGGQRFFFCISVCAHVQLFPHEYKKSRLRRSDSHILLVRAGRSYHWVLFHLKKNPPYFSGKPKLFHRGTRIWRCKCNKSAEWVTVVLVYSNEVLLHLHQFTLCNCLGLTLTGGLLMNSCNLFLESFAWLVLYTIVAFPSQTLHCSSPRVSQSQPLTSHV